MSWDLRKDYSHDSSADRLPRGKSNLRRILGRKTHRKATALLLLLLLLLLLEKTEMIDHDSW